MRYSLLAVVLIGAATLGGCTEGVLDPKGPIALAERQILLNALGIMLAIVIPVILATLGVAFWFRASNERARYRPNFAYSGRLEMLVWSIPAMTVFLVGGVAWVGSHDLSPRKPIVSTVKPLRVQVASLDWKWLFIYPDRGRRKRQSTDHSRRHAGQFGTDLLGRDEQLLCAAAWQPDLHHGGNDHPSSPAGRPCWKHTAGCLLSSAATAFPTCTSTPMPLPDEKFAQWLDAARGAGPELDAKTYADLAKPSAAVAPFTYRAVAPGLFDSIMVSEMQSDDAMCRSYPTSMRAEK